MLMQKLLFILTLLFASSVYAARIDPIFSGNRPTSDTWTPLLITLDESPLNQTVWIRDARGGLAIGVPRPVGDRTIVMNLPRLNPPSPWQIKIWMEPQQTEADAKIIDVRPLTLRSASYERIVSDSPLPNADPETEIAQISDNAILHDPPLLLAGVDAIVLSPALREKLTPDRALALRTVGVKLLYAGPTAPIGPLSKLQWTESKSNLQLSPPEILEAPKIAEELLPRIPAPEPQTNPVAKSFALFLIPAVIALVLLSRFLTARPIAATIIFASLVIIAGIVMLVTLSLTSTPQPLELTFTSRTSAGNFSLAESLFLYNSQSPAKLELKSADPVAFLPLTATESGQLNNSSDRLLLDGASATFTGKLLPYQPRAFLSRRAELSTQSSALSTSTSPAGHIVKNGYIQIPSGTPVELTAWIGSLPAAQKSAATAWYQLRFHGSQTYTLFPQSDSSLLVIQDLPDP
jgi:hypothetical protein